MEDKNKEDILNKFLGVIKIGKKIYQHNISL